MRRLVATLVVVAMAAVGVSCGSDDEPEAGGDDVSTQEARFGGTVVFGTTGESSGWLPYTDRWGPGPLTIARALFDPLVSWGTDGKVHPYLAEAFEPNEDYSVWDIVMRPDVKFHNGEDVSGHALVLYLQKARVAPLTIFAMQPIVDIQKVEGDDLRARVFLDQPWPSFPVVFSSQAGFLAAPSQINSEDSQNAIGSGPFEQFSWTPDAELVAKRFDNYWRSDDQGRKLPYLDEVRFRPVPDETTRLASLRTGDLDITQTNAPSTVAGFLSDPSTVPAGINVLTDASESDEFHAVLNTQTGPFTDPRLRKAVQLATDRQAISDAYDSIFKIADGPMSQDSEWWSDSGWPRRTTSRWPNGSSSSGPRRASRCPSRTSRSRPSPTGC